MKFSTSAHFSKPYKSYVPTAKVTCHFNFTYIKSKEGILSFSLCYLKWLSLVISLIPLGLVAMKRIIWGRSYEIKCFFLKDWNTLTVSKMGAKLFHSIIIDGKKEFLKKLCFVSNKGNIAHSSCSIRCSSYRNEIKKGILGAPFWKIYKRHKVFSTSDKVEGTIDLIIGRFFLLTYLKYSCDCWEDIILTGSIFTWKELLKAWS